MLILEDLVIYLCQEWSFNENVIIFIVCYVFEVFFPPKIVIEISCVSLMSVCFVISVQVLSVLECLFYLLTSMFQNGV